jgi:hypothetical protein
MRFSRLIAFIASRISGAYKWEVSRYNIVVLLNERIAGPVTAADRDALVL